MKNIVRNTLIAGRVQMVTCLFPHKGEENTEILNTYLTVLERDIFKVSMNQRSKKSGTMTMYDFENLKQHD